MCGGRFLHLSKAGGMTLRALETLMNVTCFCMVVCSCKSSLQFSCAASAVRDEFRTDIIPDAK